MLCGATKVSSRLHLFGHYTPVVNAARNQKRVQSECFTVQVNINIYTMILVTTTVSLGINFIYSASMECCHAP